MPPVSVFHHIHLSIVLAEVVREMSQLLEGKPTKEKETLLYTAFILHFYTVNAQTHCYTQQSETIHNNSTLGKAYEE